MPIVGANTEINLQTEILLRSALKKLNIEQEDYTDFLKKFDLRGSDRKIIQIPEDASLEFIDEKTAKITFELPSSAYATELLRELTGGHALYRDKD